MVYRVAAFWRPHRASTVGWSGPQPAKARLSGKTLAGQRKVTNTSRSYKVALTMKNIFGQGENLSPFRIESALEKG